MNSNKNKYIKDDYSYDVERIVFDDDKEFYLPYNKTALFINQQRFVTPYDIHDTMVYFVSNDYYWKSKKGQSLTDEINGLKRNCEIYMDDFDKGFIFEEYDVYKKGHKPAVIDSSKSPTSSKI